MHFSNTPAPRPSGLLRVASVNVNGIRAAYKKDMAAWWASRDIDILCLQEVRAPDAIVRELLDESQWHILHAEAAAKGRARGLGGARGPGPGCPALGPDASRVGPMICAWAAPPTRISRG